MCAALRNQQYTAVVLFIRYDIKLISANEKQTKRGRNIPDLAWFVLLDFINNVHLLR